jgi:hypothetical protein
MIAGPRCPDIQLNVLYPMNSKSVLYPMLIQLNVLYPMNSKSVLYPMLIASIDKWETLLITSPLLV